MMPSLSFLQPGCSRSIDREAHAARQKRHRSRDSFIQPDLGLEAVNIYLIPGSEAQPGSGVGMEKHCGCTDVSAQQFRGGDRDATVVETRDRYCQPLVLVRTEGIHR